MRKQAIMTLATFLILLLPAAQVIAGGGTESEAGNERTWLFRYGNQQPEEHARTISMLWFEEELERRTEGRIQVEIYHSGILGTEKEMFEMTVTGNLEGYRGAFYEQLNPQFLLYNLPFLFQSYAEMIHFNASDMARDMLDAGSVQGIYMPAVGYTGFRSLITKEKQVVMPDDLVGQKIRSPGQAPVLNFYRHFGANPQEIATSEVYLAMRQGVVDGGDNSPTNVYANNWHEVGRYFTALNYMAGADPLLTNMAWYRSLTPELQRTFNEVAIEALQYWDELEAQASLEAIAAIRNAPGVEGIDMTDYPERTAVWQEASRPLWQQFVDEGFFDWQDIERAQAIIAEVRQ